MAAAGAYRGAAPWVEVRPAFLATRLGEERWERIDGGLLRPGETSGVAAKPFRADGEMGPKSPSSRGAAMVVTAGTAFKEGSLMKSHLAILAAAAVTTAGALGSARAADDGLARLPKTADLPVGVVQVSLFIPGMGEHWADPKRCPSARSAA
jgi:hypothetical protein